ncbi:O-antigen ligase [Brevundimonas bullata]|uniref:O-antigen ligase n=1 Tax=Brevundimonas bullata TaxID=13160 RepID=A0A7W7IQ51_9CAUL|nr:O-antigen ligase family protein [Brevundimonas bullata]MBB4798238.1 O-antigen ligase [Brevundimonas bullata]MBB6383448.1 O-antigen ligase [Brevundimonas bullata]
MAGVAPVWRPLSLTPEETLDALFGVVPFAAVLMAAACLSPHQRQRLWVGTAILAFASVALGALQLASGGLRLYGDRGGAAVGFFANRNHWAVWLAASLPILAFVMSRSSSRDGRMAPLAVAILLATFVALLAGVAISGSRAGAVLLAPAVMGSVFLLWRQGGRGAGARRFLLPAAAAAAGLIFAILGTWVAASRFAGAGEDLRFDLWANAFSLALAHLPFGAGGGSFSAVYMGQETADVLTAGFVNQAHNDWVEIFVEYGVAAILPMVLAAIVVVRGARRDSNAPFIILALALLLAASIVDYPLRTPALQALTGLLLAGLASTGQAHRRRRA